MSDEAYIAALNEAVPWTAEISPEILIYAARANCVVQVETGSYFQALEDADEQGFHGQDGVAFVQVAADAYCPSMRALAGRAVTPAPTPEAAPARETDPADMRLELTGETTGFQDGTWEIEFTLEEVPGAVSYEIQQGELEGLASDTFSVNEVVEAPGGPAEGGRELVFTLALEEGIYSVNHRVRAYFEDSTVGKWSNTFTSYSPHL